MSAAATRDFPSRTNELWASNFAEALIADERVKLTPEAIDHLKWLIPDPKRYVNRTKAGYRLKDSAIHQRKLRGGNCIYLLRAKVFGCVVAESPHNDRLVGVWPSPFQDVDGNRPHLPARAQNGSEAELIVRVKDVDELRRSLRHTSKELEREEDRRAYSLAESLANEGQRESGTSVFTRYVTEDGRTFAVLSAVAGNNRAHHRNAHHNLTVEDVVLGVPTAKLGIGGEPGKVVIGAPKWIKPHLDQMERRLHGDSELEREQAERAFKVAEVEEDIVVGADPADELIALLQTDNVAEHIQSVLAYDDLPRYEALGHQLLRRHHAEGLIIDAELGVLAGDQLPNPSESPATYGLGGPWDGTAERMEELRDWRNRRLIELVFPTSRQAARTVRDVLAEPAPSSLSAAQIKHRSRLLAVMQMKAYERGWNPRAGEIYLKAHGMKGVTVTDRPLSELLAEAKPGQLSDELKLRIHPFLCAGQLVVPDRGSLDRVIVDDQGSEEPNQRRQPGNVLTALATSTRGLPFVREVLEADRENRKPRPVDVDGVPLEGKSADRTWFNSTEGFPKIEGRTRREPEPEPEPEPEQLDDVAAFTVGQDTLLTGLQDLIEQAAAVKDAVFALGEIADRDSTLRLDGDLFKTIVGETLPGLDDRIQAARAELSRIRAGAPTLVAP